MTRMKAVSLIRAALVASAAVAALATPAFAHPDNSQTLYFTLTCDDGHVWNASFNGGPVAFTIDGDALFVWKQIDYVTPNNESGSILRGIQGFAAADTVTCTYVGAVSGNHYTVTGFYPPAD
jgi:ABC-type sugar transport system substrate-binding protein